ncbi:MAG: molybdopterin molybdotransferase MoeA [Planctomycetaceae bacterium]
MTSSDTPRSDVRMRGFLSRTPVDAAIDWVDRHATPRSGESVPLADACGRVLAEPVKAATNVPAFPRSAMDGFAIRAEETIGATEYNPLAFRVVGESLPGIGTERRLQSGEAIRIMTGAPLPAGADAVVPAEHARQRGDQVELCATVASGKHVGQIGEDIAAGTTVLPEGRRLRPQDVGVAASLGIATLSVVRRPVVRLLITGNELAQPGQTLAPFQIYEANSYMLRGLIERDGAELESVRHLRDDRESIHAHLCEPGADLIVVSGGTSVGQEDFVPGLVAEIGELPIHGIAMRPSSPTGLGRIGATLVALLPGNPVSCLCAYDFFAGRALRRLGGRSVDWPHRRLIAPLTRKLVSEIGRTDYCRVRVTRDGVEPLALSGAAILSSTTRSDGFVIVAENSEGLPAGGSVTVFLYDDSVDHCDTGETARPAE